MSLLNIRFEYPYMLIIPLLLIVLSPFLLRLLRRKKPVLLLPYASRIKNIRGISIKKGDFTFLIQLVILILLSLSASVPKYVKGEYRYFTEGIDIMIVLDCSTSMEALDFDPKSRITVAKEVFREFIDSRKNDRIGLVVFAKQAYTQSPLTLDYRALKTLIEPIRTGVIEDGTAIGNAIAVAVNRLRDSQTKTKTIFLVTDGDNNAGNISPLEASELAKKFGIIIYPIMIGKDGPVPYPAGKDFFGRTVYRNVEFTTNPALLKQIAEKTGGEYFEAKNYEEFKNTFPKILDSLAKTRFEETSVYENQTDLGWYLLLVSFFLIIILLTLFSPFRKFPS
ncbi:MAG: VWA domain-containing protein [Deltaproteobacteria bacterium]|nr:VWA domain-containing protein [Deltaproteobacteria bacterium]